MTSSFKPKHIKMIQINNMTFSVRWNKTSSGASFSYGTKRITIGTASNSDAFIFELICHELMEICAIEMHVRLYRPDCDTGDYIFVYDHRQYDTMMAMFTSAILKFM